MDIEQLVTRKDALVADMTKSLKARGFDTAVIAKPIEIQENRAASIKREPWSRVGRTSGRCSRQCPPPSCARVNL